MNSPDIRRPRISGRARGRILRFGLPAIALAVTIAATTAPADAATSAVSHTPTPVGSIATVPAGAAAAAAPNDATTIDVDIALNPRNAAELAEYSHVVSDPNSVFYKQYLTKRQAHLLFAPSQSTVNAVSASLRAAGLHPGAPIDGNFYIPVTATIGQLKQAFNIGFAGYRLADGRTAFNATTKPGVDASIASDVSGIVGLDDFLKPNADHRSPSDDRLTQSVSVASSSRSAADSDKSGSIPSMCSSFTAAFDSLLAKYGYTAKDGSTYYSPTALASAYGYAKQLKSGDQGQGVTVAVEEWEAVSHQAISDYIGCVGSHSKVRYNTSAAGTQVQPTATNGVGSETTLDIETIASIAPKASIIDYEGPDITASFTDADWLDTFAAPVAADSANVISLSWTTCEGGAIDTTLENSQTSTLQLAAVQGQSFFVSTGDNGSEGCNSEQQHDPTIAAGDPANNPAITAVGGTRMQGLTDPTVTPWNDSAKQLGATGGGVSIWQSLSGSANYQAGFVGPGYSNVCGAAKDATCRQVPDISALGDPYTAVPLMYYANGSAISITEEGGTSLAAPIMAGITGLADSSARCALNGPAGFINPLIYDLAKNPATYADDFQDETTGSNAYSPSGYAGSLDKAAKGYDMASGLGSPKAATLIPALCAPNKKGPTNYGP
jgi:subtilase family serine protease